MDAARTLLAEMFSTGLGRETGELALYWAARAKLEEVDTPCSYTHGVRLPVSYKLAVLSGGS